MMRFIISSIMFCRANLRQKEHFGKRNALFFHIRADIRLSFMLHRISIISKILRATLTVKKIISMEKAMAAKRRVFPADQSRKSFDARKLTGAASTGDESSHAMLTPPLMMPTTKTATIATL